MIKIKSSILQTILFLFITIVLAGRADADTLKGQRLVCLQATQCNSASAGCFTGKDGHTASLKSVIGNPSRPNSKTYIVECISTSVGQVCTTGNADKLADISWDSSLTDLQALTGYQFQGLYDIRKVAIDQSANPIMTDAEGMIPTVEWKSATSQATDHSFYALNILDNVSYVTDGYNESQKQATFELMFEDDSDCASLRWDPYGTIFDSKTLEPIPGATVTLYEKENGVYGGPARIPGVNNPVRTEADGVFNFVVPDGTYKLNAAAGNYQALPTSLAEINKAYLNVYSNIYTGEEATQDIIQKDGVPQLRNIPLVPNAGYTGSYPVKVINYTQAVDKTNGIFTIRGTVSHPFADIRVYTSLVGTTNIARYLPLDFHASKNGAFTISIKLSLLEPTEIVGGIEATKKNFSQPQINSGIIRSIISSVGKLLGSSVIAQEVDQVRMPIPPILNNIDGYAYDDSGTLLTNATVGVYVKFSDKLVFETKTDDSGHFTIDSAKLPPIPYVLKYTTKSNKQLEVTTEKYLKDNAVYIQRTNQNPNNTQVFPSNAPGQSVSPAVIVSPTVAVEEDKPKTNSLLSLAIVMVVAIIVIGGIFYFLRRDNVPKI